MANDNVSLLNSNDKLSDLKRKDLNTFIKEILGYKLKLRSNLGINSQYTFGFELEFENISISFKEFEELFKNLKINKGRIIERYHDTDSWCIKDDKTLTETNGKEIVTPILTDEFIYWQDLVKMCAFIKKYAKVGSHCAGHIHIGSQAIGDKKETFLNLIKIWGVYENVLYRFGYNEYLSKLPNIKYSHFSSETYLSLYNELIKSSYSVELLIQSLNNRLNAINFTLLTLVSNCNRIAYKDTIEFRSPNGTLDPIIWQNNLNTFIKLLEYVKSSKFDLDIVNRRERLNKKNPNFNDYNQIFIEEAIEFADLIFNNNLDKLYFLRQYIKNNDVSYEEMKRTKKFTI